MKKLTIISLLFLSCFVLSAHSPVPNSTAIPFPSQQAWMDLGFGMFVHFGINTY